MSTRHQDHVSGRTTYASPPARIGGGRHTVVPHGHTVCARSLSRPAIHMLSSATPSRGAFAPRRPHRSPRRRRLSCQRPTSCIQAAPSPSEKGGARRQPASECKLAGRHTCGTYMPRRVVPCGRGCSELKEQHPSHARELPGRPPLHPSRVLRLISSLRRAAQPRRQARASHLPWDSRLARSHT